MVRIDKYSIKSRLQRSSIINTHPLITKHIDSVADFIVKETGGASQYQKLWRRFYAGCANYYNDKMNIGKSASQFLEYIEKYCMRDLHIFHVCAKYNLEEFQSAKYISDFWAQPIVKVIEIFDIMNLSQNISYTIRTNVTVYNIMLKICINYCVIKLAQIFAIINLSMQNDSLDTLAELYTGKSSVIINSKFNQHLKNDITLEKIINDIDSELMQHIISYMSGDNIDEEFKSAQKCATSVFNQFKTIYNFSMYTSDEDFSKYCDKHPDFAAVLSYTNTKNPFIKCSLSNIFLAYFLSQNGDIPDCPTQVKNLTIPDKKLFHKILLIEI